MKKHALLIAALLLSTSDVFCQLGIGTTSPISSAMLEVYSTSKGFLPPRLTTSQVSTISPLINGLMLFNLTTNTLWIYRNGVWHDMGIGGSLWTTSGASIYPVNLTNRLGIGTSVPQSMLHVAGADPLRLDGLSTNTSSTDLMVMEGNIVKKRTFNLDNAWVTTGNSISSSSFIGSTNPVDFSIRTNNTEKMRITSGGKVGIGISNPGTLLTLGSNITGLSLYGNNWISMASTANYYESGVAMGSQSYPNNYFRIYWYENAGNGYGAIETANYTVPLTLQYGNTGSVGIGTSAPETTLDIAGDIAYHQGVYFISPGNNNNCDYGGYSLVRLSCPGSFMITGIANGSNGRIITIHNSSPVQMIIANENTNSSVANRITTNTGGNLSTADQGSVTLQYSSYDQRWIVIGFWQ